MPASAPASKVKISMTARNRFTAAVLAGAIVLTGTIPAAFCDPTPGAAATAPAAVADQNAPAPAVDSDQAAPVAAAPAVPDQNPPNVSGPAGADAATYGEKLDGVDVSDVPLRDALDVIATASGLNLAATEEAAKTRVSLRLHDVTPYEAVETLCQTHGLYFKVPTAQDGIGVVTTVAEFQQGLTIFREEKTQVYTLLYPNATDLAVAIRDLFGNRVRVTLGKEGVIDEADDIQRRFERFDLFDQRASGITFSPSSGSNGGSGGGEGGGGGNSSSSNRTSSSSSGSVSGSGLLSSLPDASIRESQNPDQIQNLTPEQLARLGELVHQQGVANAIDAAKLNGLGQDTTPIYVSVIQRNNQVLVRTSDPGVFDEIDRIKQQIDVPTPQVLLEVKILSVDLSDGFNSVFDYQFGDGNNSASFSSGDIQPPPTPGSLLIGGTGGTAPFALNNSSLIYQWVSNNFKVRMQMLESKNRVTTLATPLLLVANNEVSRVFVGQEQPIVQAISSQTTATQGVVTSTPQTTFTFQPIGTTLLITPNINADHTVTLRLIEETSSVITGGATIPIVGSNGTVTNQPVDIVSATTLTGTLVAKDGLSLALGGLITENVTDTRQGVPVLGELPLIGILFRRQSTGRDRSEAIIVIRPFILSTPSEAVAESKRLVDANSLHPSAPQLNAPQGSPIGGMGNFLRNEALRPNPPRTELEHIFQLHSTLPTDY
jgi:general secretion pathway protein D